MIDYAGIVRERMATIGCNDGRPGSVAPCLQVPGEMAWLAPFVDALQPSRILEIGIYKGGWQYVLAPFFAPGAHIVGIDAMLRHKWRGDDVQGLQLEAMLGTLREMGLTAELIRGYSNDQSVIAEAKARFGGEQIDLLHIDGAHDYASVMVDWQTYRPMVRSGGMVVLHDTGTLTSQMRVKQVWQEIKATGGYVTHECYEKNGIGIAEIP